MLKFLILYISFVMFGVCLEVFFTGLSYFPRLFDGKKDDRDILTGHISLWMKPVYGILITFLFIPLYNVLIFYNISFYIRYIIWAITITSFEVLSGWFYDKGLAFITNNKFNVKPWTYSEEKDSILNGYTRLYFIPLWGIVGLLLEVYVYTMINVSDIIIMLLLDFIKNYF